LSIHQQPIISTTNVFLFRRCYAEFLRMPRNVYHLNNVLTGKRVIYVVVVEQKRKRAVSFNFFLYQMPEAKRNKMTKVSINLLGFSWLFWNESKK